MALDYSKLSDEELQAIANNDYSKLSDATLNAIASEPETKQKKFKEPRTCPAKGGMKLGDKCGVSRFT
jgi:hypothetical protein